MPDFAKTQAAVTIGLPFTDQPVEQFTSAVRSVFAQSHQNWRLILLADGASPQNLEYARSIEDERVYLQVHTTQGGLARRLNDIAAMTETAFLFRMDADDVMHPKRISRQLSVLEGGRADLVGSRAYLIDGTDHIHGLMKEPRDVPPTLQMYLANRPILMHPTLAAPTEWFRTNPYDDSLLRAQDKALFIKSAVSTRMLKMTEPLLFYRIIRPISPKRQANSYHYDRIVVKKYGPLVASPDTVRKYIIKSHVKQRVFQSMSHFGGGQYLFDRKVEPLNRLSLAQAAESFCEAQTASVPGWPQQ